jgi:endonuclease YncB( thermonuclease family)
LGYQVIGLRRVNCNSNTKWPLEIAHPRECCEKLRILSVSLWLDRVRQEPRMRAVADPLVLADTDRMGDGFDFRTMLGSRPRRRWQRNVVPFGRARSRTAGKSIRLVASGLLVGSLLGIAGMHWSGRLPIASATAAAPTRAASPPDLGIGCISPKVVDGDTLRCGSTRIRLSSIDAPEMPGHCRPGRQCTPGDPFASTANLRSLVVGQATTCRQLDTDRYGRAVAFCSADGRDLSCAQVQSGHAIVRYGALNC